MIDVEALQKDTERIISFSQAYPFKIDISALISKWMEAKKKIIDLFGGKTIIRSSKIIKIKLPKEQREKCFSRFLATLEQSTELTDDFKQFLLDNQDGFFDNKVMIPDLKHDIKPGAKLSKSFKKFISEMTTLRWMQDTASQFMQKDNIEGYLYLSVDPRDFLTISENDSNWGSCHKLDGEYRAGNLSYMVDDVTIVAYLADEEQRHLKCIPSDMVWNNKKWRMLIHMNSNVIYYNRQYPYTSEDLLQKVYEMIETFTPGGFKSPVEYGFKTVKNDSGYQITNTNHMYIGDRIFDTRDIVDISDSLGYCDIISSHIFTPILSLSETLYDEIYSLNGVAHKDRGYIEELSRAKAMYGIKIGETIPCVCCGKGVVKQGISFLCPSCIEEHDAEEDFFLTCEGCGCRIYGEKEAYYIKDGYGWELPYCKECYRDMRKLNKILTKRSMMFK